MSFTEEELVEAFEAADELRTSFPVNNPRPSIADMKRHLAGEPEHFVCYGGYKSFYMDWNFDLCVAMRGESGCARCGSSIVLPLCAMVAQPALLIATGIRV